MVSLFGGGLGMIERGREESCVYLYERRMRTGTHTERGQLVVCWGHLALSDLGARDGRP